MQANAQRHQYCSWREAWLHFTLWIDILGPWGDSSEDAMHHLVCVVEEEYGHPALQKLKQVLNIMAATTAQAGSQRPTAAYPT